MKLKTKKEMFILTLGVILVLLALSTTPINTNPEKSYEAVQDQNEPDLKTPKISGVYSESFIHIDGNWSDATGKGWFSGDGSWGNPYVIENVTIDASSSPTGSGIFINNSKNDYFIINNCTVYNADNGAFDAGIKLENTNNGVLSNNNCSDNGETGIGLYYDSDNNMISGNTANENDFNGICLRNGCENNIISGNTAGNVGTSTQNYGIYLYYCDNNTISGNTANNSDYNGMNLFYCDNNIISENNANDNDYHGIYLYDCDNNTILRNNANYNYYHGIYLQTNCDENTISGNTANDNYQHGIHFFIDCDNNTISGNTVNNNTERGINLENDCDNNTISGNTVNNNTENGIYLNLDCDNNTISGNMIKDNVNNGIHIRTTDCENNTIYYNSFIGTGLWHARDEGTNNHWNNSIIGNYWDNHTSPDSDNDGIVDAPYTWITGTSGSVDNFPLVGSPVHEGEKIHIDDTGVSAWKWSKTAKLMSWCTGSGTYLDPYIIDGLEIDGGGSGSCILIGNSSVYFIIRDVMVYKSGNTIWDAGIKLENTNNGTLINCNCSNNGWNGILLYDRCENNTISGNTANNNNIHGIYIYDGCDNNTISGNTANTNDEGIRLNSGCDNNTISGNTANHNVNNGIHIYYYCNDNIISGNTANYDWNGILLYDRCENNTISGNNANDNYNFGIFFFTFCENNTVTGNTASNVETIPLSTQDKGIVLALFCNNNTISGNTANNNIIDGIFLEDYSNDNIIAGNTANNNNIHGIYIYDDCDNNTISGNTANTNLYGIYLAYSNYNTITGNTAIDGGVGVYLDNHCDNNNITDNYIYFNTNWAIKIDSADCGWNNIKRNVLVSSSENFIFDDGTNTLKKYNYYGMKPPSFIVEVIAQSFSITEFIVTINISSQMKYIEDLDISLQIWWNNDPVTTNNIAELGNGLYNISLTPKLVKPDEAPIILNMTISALYHSNRYYELKFKVDPEAVAPAPAGDGGGGGGGGGGGKKKKAEAVIPGYNIIILIGVLCVLSVVLIKKRSK